MTLSSLLKPVLPVWIGALTATFMALGATGGVRAEALPQRNLLIEWRVAGQVADNRAGAGVSITTTSPGPQGGYTVSTTRRSETTVTIGGGSVQTRTREQGQQQMLVLNGGQARLFVGESRPYTVWQWDWGSGGAGVPGPGPRAQRAAQLAGRPCAGARGLPGEFGPRRAGLRAGWRQPAHRGGLDPARAPGRMDGGGAKRPAHRSPAGWYAVDPLRRSRRQRRAGNPHQPALTAADDRPSCATAQDAPCPPPAFRCRPPTASAP